MRLDDSYASWTQALVVWALMIAGLSADSRTFPISEKIYSNL
jgi:hypothetical protein